MSYEIEKIRLSQEIFYYLLKRHEISDKAAPELYRAYVESEEIQYLVKSQGEAAECMIERYGDVVYLIPEEDNSFLGYSKAQLKKELCRSGATDRDYYLSQFAILVLLIEFYDGQGSSAKVKTQLKVGEWQNLISERLKDGVSAYEGEREDTAGMAFSDMLYAYESLKSDETGKRPKTTKEGFLHSILSFLDGQGLIHYVLQDEMILTTEKLDNLMSSNLLNERNMDRVRRVLGSLDNEA